MICRLFCKHAKKCKSDMRAEEKQMYEKIIAGLENELRIANKNVEDLTHTIDEYEVELQKWQDGFENEVLKNNRLEIVLADTLRKYRTLKEGKKESDNHA